MWVSPMWIPLWDYLESEGGILVPQKKEIITTSKWFDPEAAEKTQHLTAYQLLVILWMHKWDEWKWTESYRMVLAYIERYWKDEVLLISSVWWDNAWHVVYFPDGTSFTWHILPGGAATWVDVFLGQDKAMNILWLIDEIQDIRSTENAAVLWNIFISKDSHCSFPLIHWKLDWVIEDIKSQNKNKKGWTTWKWVWPNQATKALRVWITIEELLDSSDEKLKSLVDILVWLFEWYLWSIDEIYREVFHHRNKLREIMEAKLVEIVESTYARDALREWKAWVLEWSQSVGLSSKVWLDKNNPSIYRQNTAPDTSFGWNLAWLGINPVPWQVGILWVYKALTSAVWTHDFPWRISNIYPSLKWLERKFARETGEKWSTTNRPRQIGYMDATVIANFIINHLDFLAWISIRKLDLANQFLETMNLKNFPIIVGYDDNGKPILERVEASTEIIMSTIVRIVDETIKEKLPNKNKFTKDEFDTTITAWFGPQPDDSYTMTPDSFR